MKMKAGKIGKLKDWIRTTLGFSKKIEIDYKRHPQMKMGTSEELLVKKVIYIKKDQ